MRTIPKRCAAVLVGLVLLACSTSRAAAYYPFFGYRYYWRYPPVYYQPYPVYGYYPGFPGAAPQGFGPSTYYAGDPYAGYLQGAAAVIDSQGQYVVNIQQAYLQKEKVRQAQIENRRKAFDEWLYERAHMPTLNEQREQQRQDDVRRALNDPPLTEPWAGYSLNTILVELQDLESRKIIGPDVPLEADVLTKINVFPAKGQGNVGLLKERALSWPIGLRIVPPAMETRPLRDKIDKLLAEGREQAAKGRVKAELLAELRDNLARLRKFFKQRAEDMPFAQYTESKRFLADLDTAARVLEQPDAADYVTARYAARGRTVRELVQYMTENGLRFGPVGNGAEAAYNALYQALAGYARELVTRRADK